MISRRRIALPSSGEAIETVNTATGVVTYDLTGPPWSLFALDVMELARQAERALVPFTLPGAAPTRNEVIDVLRTIVNRWSGDYHCCADDKHRATHSQGCPLVAGLLLLARIGQSGHTISPQGAAQAQQTPEIGGSQTDIRPLPDKSGYSCHWFARRDRDYYCDQGEGHRGPHHNRNVADDATWVDRPPDGVWLDSDGIPGPPVAKKP